jgi:hypothetical protein
VHLEQARAPKGMAMQRIPQCSHEARSLAALAIGRKRPERRMLLGGTALLGITLLVLLWPSDRAIGHDISRAECTEGSEFIRNAALARDNGLSREAYIGQLRGDLISIRAFPPELRWFAQDEQDEALLLSAASEVFDDPKPPESHRQAFMQRCLGSPSHHS